MQEDLSNIWPTLKFILKVAGKVDDFMVDFSMKIARNGAWKFAKSIANTSLEERNELINQRDRKVARKANIITSPGIVAGIIFKIIRLGERGSVSYRILELEE